ncbi:hypothetical protein OROGR_017202 [Orobanche gracilis]
MGKRRRRRRRLKFRNLQICKTPLSSRGITSKALL